jgi:hypothetical protein
MGNGVPVNFEPETNPKVVIEGLPDSVQITKVLSTCYRIRWEQGVNTFYLIVFPTGPEHVLGYRNRRHSNATYYSSRGEHSIPLSNVKIRIK